MKFRKVMKCEMCGHISAIKFIVITKGVRDFHLCPKCQEIVPKIRSHLEKESCLTQDHKRNIEIVKSLFEKYRES